jgi:hypothetical protein
VQVIKLALRCVWEQVKQTGEETAGEDAAKRADAVLEPDGKGKEGGQKPAPAVSRVHPASEVLRLLLANEVDVWLDEEAISLLDFRHFCSLDKGDSINWQQHPTSTEMQMMREWRTAIVAPPSECLIHAAGSDVTAAVAGVNAEVPTKLAVQLAVQRDYRGEDSCELSRSGKATLIARATRESTLVGLSNARRRVRIMVE